MSDPFELVNLGDTFGGYYRASDEDWARVLQTGLVVLDTNALLDLYRLSPLARDELFKVLETLKDRLFVPHQVASEFHKRRLDAVADRIAEIQGAATTMRDHAQKVRGSSVPFPGAHAGDAAVDSLLSQFVAAFDGASEFVDQVASEYDLEPERLLLKSDDPVLLRLETVLQGRVAPQPPVHQLEADREEGSRRADAELPPGFKDAKKEANSFGDYLWWAEVVRYAAAHPADVLLVCNDVAKGDWTYDKRGMRVGPATELVEEMAAATGRHLLMCTTAELLDRAAKHLKVNISANTVSETRHLPETLIEFKSARGKGSHHRVIPNRLLRALIGTDPRRLQPWIEQDYLPDLADDMWLWDSVRSAAVVAECLSQEMPPRFIANVLDALDERVAGKNQLVVASDGQCSWVRRRDVDAFVAQLDKEPQAVLDYRLVDTRLHRRLSALEAKYPGDPDLLEGLDEDALMVYWSNDLAGWIRANTGTGTWSEDEAG